MMRSKINQGGKMVYRVIGISFLLASGCVGEDQSHMSTLEAPPQAVDMSMLERGPADKVDICHWSEDDGAFEVINISGNAVGAHMANHGDGYPGSYWPDADGDGYGDAGGDVSECPNPGTVGNADDCDDSDPAFNLECGVNITVDGEAYGHHGACSGWNGCGDAATCAEWACEINGYATLVSYGDDKPCTQFDVCHLFYSEGNIQWNWGNWCDVQGVTDIVCQ
jgi:hypothetical protein